MSEIQYEYTVAGKRVTLKKALPAKEAHLLPKLLLSYDGDTDIIRNMGQIAIDSWGFNGDPKDARSYAGMDIFDELYPLGKALINYINARMAAAQEAMAELPN